MPSEHSTLQRNHNNYRIYKKTVNAKENQIAKILIVLRKFEEIFIIATKTNCSSEQ